MYLLYVLCIISFKKTANKLCSSKHGFLRRCVSVVWWGMPSVDVCKAVQQISGAALAHNGSQQAKDYGGALVGGWERAGPYLELGWIGPIAQHFPVSSSFRDWFSSQLYGKVLNGGVGNTNAPSSTSGPASGEACGQVALWLLCARRGIRCSWDKAMRMVSAWLITILEKHNSEMCKAVQSSVISFMLTENRFLADFFFSLAVLIFSLKMRRRKASLQGQGQAETLAN